MFKLYSTLLFLLLLNTVSAQNTVVISGKVVDATSQKPIELATVYFSSAKDSTLIEYSTTDKNGDFKLNTKKYENPILLKINYLGYKTYVSQQKSLLENKDFGKIPLTELTNTLDEVVIKLDAPPIRIKKDTLEFNAASFKVRPDANVEALLKTLPGFEVDSDGKITVNGKEVSQFLVNGKTFFDKDGAIALKNLPAEIISKIQVSDYKTKKEELSKQESTSDYSSINLTIDEKKNKGYFGKFLAGYGTDERYESSFIINYFKNKQKISLLASSNNINAPGFSQDEVFDSMGGGRNARGNGRAAANSKGITQSNLVGFNYNDEWSKKMQTMGSYNFSNSETNNQSNSNQVELSSTGNINTVAESKSTSENTGNKANFEFEYKINPTTRLVFTPSISESHSTSYSNSFSTAKDVTNEPLNESSSASNRTGNSLNFGNTINFNKAFAKKSRNLSFVFNNSKADNVSDAVNVSKTTFYKNPSQNIDRNQIGKTNNTSESYSVDIEYTEPITDSLRIRIGSEFALDNQVNDLKTYDNGITLNDSQSNYTNSKQNSISPKLGLNFEKNNFTFNINSRASILDYNNHALYKNETTDLIQKYVLPFANAQIRYKLDRSKFLTLRYDYSNSLPSSTQLMPVKNLANPLNTIVGNPDLKLNEKSSLNLNFRNFDMRTRSGYAFYIRGDYYNSEVVSIVSFGSGGQKTTEYTNVSGTYTTSVGGNWNQTIKKNAHVLRYSFGINGGYSLDKVYTNKVLFDANSFDFTPRVNFSYDYGELFTIAPTYSMTYNETKYENTGRLNSSVVHRANIQTTNYWPKNWVFGNDIGYTFNSNISGDFKKDFYLWNTSLSYLFFQKKMTLKVKVYDVLNQNQSATRSISSTIIRDEQNTVLKRYVMFSLAYKMGSFGGSKDRRNQGNGPGNGGNRRGGGDMNMD